MAGRQSLPDGLPDWFAELDVNRDAQVSLYEWKSGGKSVSEFERLDRNGDGFVTVEELLYLLQRQGKGGPANNSTVQGGDTGWKGAFPKGQKPKKSGKQPQP
jgi:hypothetical protein